MTREELKRLSQYHQLIGYAIGIIDAACWHIPEHAARHLFIEANQQIRDDADILMDGIQNDEMDKNGTQTTNDK